GGALPPRARVGLDDPLRRRHRRVARARPARARLAGPLRERVVRGGRARRRGRRQRPGRGLRGPARALARADARAGRGGHAALARGQRVPERRQARPARRAPGLPAGRDAVARPRASGGDLVNAIADPAAIARLETIRAIVGAIPDPEIPVVTLADLGILRDVALDDGAPLVLLTPTYSGCPATEAIAAQVR